MSYYSSRSIPKGGMSNEDETFTTQEIYVNSQNGTIPLAGYSNINAGFTVILANPIILDINHRYVIALIKSSVDITDYTTGYTTFDLNCDLIEYQYKDNLKTQLLYQLYDLKYVPASPTEISPFFTRIVIPNYKFINPTQKIISRISFWLTDSTTGAPLTTPALGSYPTKLDVLIKKVNSHVVLTSTI